MKRRDFIKLTAGVTAMGMVGFPFISCGATAKRVVVIGGGAGGATAAKYIKMGDASIEVTLVEQNPDYYTCFMSNEVIGGERTLDSIKFGYDGLKKHGINFVQSLATAIDPIKKTVTLADGKNIEFDKLVVSPGIDFKWDGIEGYSAEIAEKIPHAWKAGPQTALLRKQLEAMSDGGVVLISSPADPFRCPPGPYERASQIAMYLKQHKPKSKVIILDAKDTFAKQGLFMQGWKEMYGYGTDNSLIEWVSAANQGSVSRINAATMSVYSGELEDEHKGNVLNIIPPQQAGKIAVAGDLVDEKGWCPVDRKTFESTKHKDIYVIGDACDASKMPKSAYSANSQAKVCAAAIIATLDGQSVGTPAYLNTCYSIVGHDYGISVAGVYRLGTDGVIAPVEGSGGVTPEGASAEDKKREVAYAHSWFNNITQDMFE